MVLEDTIAAISTPVGEGAIAIVRMSGPQAIAIADKLFMGKAKLEVSPSHSLQHGGIVDSRSNQAIDEVLVSVMRAPTTYTGEDMIEINCHGGLLVTRKILELTLDSGARLATPGEFTKRAFLNGRMDLAQAEGVVDLIRSKANLSMRVALDQLRGDLSREIGKIRQRLIEALALVEVELDFSDQELDANAREQALLALERAGEIASQLLRGFRIGRQLREGFSVVIVGRPNVGKSSLFNAILKSNRAIVTHIPGTTRDTICEQLEMEGIPIRLVDTAGLHASRGLVEKEGVRRTREQMSSADFLIVLLDGSEPLRKEDQRILQETKDRERFVVINKTDLPSALDVEELEKQSLCRIRLFVSAKQGDGICNLARGIRKKLLDGQGPDVTEPLVSRVRHQEALKRVAKNIQRAGRELTKGTNEELVAVDLREAVSNLGQITGETYNEEILEHIFSQFCVGK
jgi:tRNA modification GTPase